MEDTKTDGGPAFPVHGPFGTQAEGMSLRDWFAGQALVSMGDGGYADARAAWAYKQADAMLKARAK